VWRCRSDLLSDWQSQLELRIQASVDVMIERTGTAFSLSHHQTAAVWERGTSGITLLYRLRLVDGG